MNDWLEQYKPIYCETRRIDDWLSPWRAAAILLNVDYKSKLGRLLTGHHLNKNANGQRLVDDGELAEDWIKEKYRNNPSFAKVLQEICDNKRDFIDLYCKFLGLIDALSRSDVIMDPSTHQEDGDDYVLKMLACIEWAEARGVVVDSNIKQAYKMPSESVSNEPYCNVSHPGYSKELDVAVRAWIDVISNQTEKPKGQSFKKVIRSWLDKNHSDLSNEAKERIATLVNPNKAGGAPITGNKT